MISLTTAIIEFSLAIILLLFFKKSTLRNFFAAFILFLGFYQFTEFMVCTSGNQLLWAKMGVITFSFLPAIALHAVTRFVRKNPNLIFLYLIPVLASASILIYPIIINVSCGTLFVETHTIFGQTGNFLQSLPFLIYVLYYLGFLILAGLLFYYDYKKQRSKLKREIEIIELVGVLLMTVPAFILILIFPLLGLKFASILCQFALFVAIAAFIGVYLESKVR